MTPQIKQRIEQIRRGEIPEGYKKTKVGIVPEEWEEGFLGNYIQEYKELSKILKNIRFIPPRVKDLFRNPCILTIVKRLKRI